ncbi:hypothetical protein [Halomarina rubra]|uniref:Uncharacterized protein n=1 Tax=Halomarina rubra TaxID=2071873 RepID=A0ABD6AW27_9EURY|nr:hypothetical protein [Halomarina rubra]
MVPPAGDGGSPAPLDRPILEFFETRLNAAEFVERATITDESGHLELAVELTTTYYPEAIDEATLSIRWYTNDDFKIHYRDVASSSWECRWDRHPNPHNMRDHYHPPPTAPTPGEDASWPDDFRDVLRLVLDEVERRIEALWGEI